jgi:hypothetical protein
MANDINPAQSARNLEAMDPVLAKEGSTERAPLYPVAEKKSAANGGSRARREEANTGEELFAVLFEVAVSLPRNLDGLDRRQLGSRQSCIDGREHHAATATTLDQHSRHRRPHARDTLRLGKNQRHCRSSHHQLIRSNGRANLRTAGKSGS